MNDTISHLTQDSIYDSLPALECYLDSVRLRREHRRANRRERERLETSIALVRVERQAALDDEDAEITFELDAALAEFQRRLDLLAAPLHSPPTYAEAVVSSARVIETPIAETRLLEGSAAPATEFSTPLPERSGGLEAPEIQEQLAAPFNETNETAVVAQIVAREELHAEPAPIELEIAAEIPAPQPMPRSAQEMQAIADGLAGRLAALEAKWRDFDAQRLYPNEDVNRPNCLRARALTCAVNALCAEADAEGLHDILHPAAQDTRNKISMARQYAHDSELCLPFEDFCYEEYDGFRLTAKDWSDLGAYYERAAVAQEAWNWHAAQQSELPASAGYDLLNAVGAAQQMLFRMLSEFGAGDRLQAELYAKLREASDTVGFLDSMHPATEWSILEARAERLPDLLRDAQQFLITAAEKREKEQRRLEAIQAVVAWSQERDWNDLSEDAVSRDRDALLPRLDACLAAGVPPTNPLVRGALLDSAPRLLDGLAPYAKILEAVRAERKRKMLDGPPAPPEDSAVEEEDLPDSQIEKSLEVARAFAENLKIVIIGGTAKPQVAEKLKQMLRCREVEWLDSKKGDHMSKFKTEIRSSDIVIAVKKFASHEMTEKSRVWAKEFGINHVLLPSGYGANQIINQICQQLAGQESAQKPLTAPTKSTGIKISLSVGNRAFTPMKSRD